METFSSAETPTRCGGRGRSAVSPSASCSSTGGPQTPSSASAFRIPFSGDGDDSLEAELSQLLQEHSALEREASRKNRKIKQLTENVVKVQSEAEIEEEKITNRLLKRLDKAKRNKASIEEQLRRETMEKAEVTSQIASVQASLVELENQIETEQNCILHKLQRELIDVSAMKANVQRALHAERGKYLMFMREAIDRVVANMNAKHNANGNGDAAPETLANAVTDGKKEGEEVCSPPYSPLSPDNHPYLQYPPTGGPLPPSAATVAVLQNELNTLLNDHFASEQALAEDTMVSDLLAQMLGRVHNEVAMERDRLSLMESELQRARAEVAIAERSSAGTLRGGRGGGNAGGSGNLQNNKNDIQLINQNYENETPLRPRNERLGGEGEGDADATESESASTATTPAAGAESVAKTHSFRGRGGGGGAWPTVPGASMSLNNTSQLMMNTFISGGGVSAESGLGAAVAPSFSLLRRLQESMGGGTGGTLGFSATESEDGDVSTCSSYVLPTPFTSASAGPVVGLSSSARHGGIGTEGGATGGASGQQQQQPIANSIVNNPPPPRPQSRGQMPPFSSASLAQHQYQQCPSPSSFSNNSRHARAVSLTGLSHPRGPSASDTPNTASSHLLLPSNQIPVGAVSSGGPLLTPIGHGHGNPIFSSSCHSVSVRSPSVSSAASCSSAAVMRNHTHQVLATALSSTAAAVVVGVGGRDKDRESTVRSEQ